jgi:hypothetical protein
MTPRILIYGGTFCDTEENREMVKLWSKVVRGINRDCDVLVIDSCSPFDPRVFLAGEVEVVGFETNVGHLCRGGQDGAGRTLTEGMLIAAERGYDYCVHWETDLLFARPIRPIVEKMARTGVKVAALPQKYYQFLEWGISFYNVRHMIESRFVERYCWQTAPTWPIPEIRIEQLVQDDLFLLPYRGMRNDMNEANVENLAGLFPYMPPDYITRATLPLCHEFLRLNGLQVNDARAA